MTCAKTAYRSRRIAEEVLRKRTRENRTLDLRAYLCPDCGKWHLSHKYHEFDGEKAS